MALEENPYEVTQARFEKPLPGLAEVRRPPLGTFLLIVSLVFCGIELWYIALLISTGDNPLPFIAETYHDLGRWSFLPFSMFFILETTGPWVVIYYLTGRRARTIEFDNAIGRMLRVSLIMTVAMSLLLTLFCEVAGP